MYHMPPGNYGPMSNLDSCVIFAMYSVVMFIITIVSILVFKAEPLVFLIELAGAVLLGFCSERYYQAHLKEKETDGNNQQ